MSWLPKQTVVAPVDFSEDSLVAVDTALQMVDDPSHVHVVHVIYEGVADLGIAAIEDSTKLKTFILQAAEAELEDELEKARGRFKHLESATLWNPRTWEAVLHAAENAEADLIIRATGEQESIGDRVASVVRTPDEWNLLRHATVPVMLVKAAAWPENPVVVCSLDVFDDSHAGLNRSVLTDARQLADLMGADLDLVYAYPLFEPWVGELGAIKSYAEIKAAVEEEARERADALAADAGITYRHLHLEEGQTAPVLAKLVEDAEASLLVLGTHAREGVRGVLLGNTSERILHAVDCDVVTVHAP